MNHTCQLNVKACPDKSFRDLAFLTVLNIKSESLTLATPNRNNIQGLVDHMKNPTTYDGEEEISEIHPSIKSADIFTEMRNLTDDDLVSVAGHILLQAKVVGDKCKGGKIYY